MTSHSQAEQLAGDVQGSPQETSFADMVKLLEFEIGHIRTEQSKPGWTKWALMGGLATTLWLLTLELEQKKIRGRHVIFLFLLLSLSYDSVKLVSSVISKPLPHRSAGRFVMVRTRLTQDRPLTIL